MKFTGFTIYGERCSGTNFIRKLVVDNFDLVISHLPSPELSWKHFFGHPENKDAIKNSTSSVIFCIVRNPIDSLMSFWNNPHHQPPERKKDLLTFLTSEFYSTNKEGELLVLDTFIEENYRKFKNIFEMRAVKSRFLFSVIPSLTNNSVFWRYEDLKSNTVALLTEVEQRFGLSRKHEEFVVETKRIVPQSRGWSNFDLSDNPLKEDYVVPDEAKGVIRDGLDFEVESTIGYEKESILKRLE